LTFETMQPCQLDYAGRDDLLRFPKDHADAAFDATQLFETVLMRIVLRARSGCHIRSQRGLPDSLLETSADGEVSHGEVRVRLAKTHEEISQLVGTRRETITCSPSSAAIGRTELKGSTLIIHNQPALKNMVRAQTAFRGTSDTHYAELVAAKGRTASFATWSGWWHIL
jgi:hypothetical protein